MMALMKTIKDPLKNMEGFTIIELIVVTVMVSILSSIAIVNYIPLRKKALDTMALADTRNFAESVVEAALDDQDVNYQKGDFITFGTTGIIGEVDTSGDPRTPVFTLSPGVAAIITGSSSTPSITAYIYHTNGTVDTTPANISGSGRKEYVCVIDIPSGLVSLP